MIELLLKLLFLGVLVSALGLALKGQRGSSRRQFWIVAALTIALLPPVAWNVRSLVIRLPVAEPPQTGGGASILSNSEHLMLSTPPKSGADPFNRPGSLLATYGFIGFALLVRLSYGILRARTLAARANPVQDPRVLSLAQQAGLASTPVKLSREINSPCVSGMFHSVVILPEFALSWSDQELRASLVHEMEHVRNHDCIWHLALLGLAAVQWLNPFAWLAARGFRIAAEEAADEAVLRSGIEPTAYAQQLLGLARGFNRGLVMSMVGGRSMNARIQLILRGNSRQSKGALVAAALIPTLSLPVAAVSVSQVAVDPFKWSRVTPEASKIELSRISVFQGDKSVTWNPDGSPSTIHPWVRPSSNAKITPDQRLIVFDLSTQGIGGNPGIEVFVNGSPALSWSSILDRTLVQAIVPSNSRIADLKVGAASGQWHTWIKDVPTGGSFIKQESEGDTRFVEISQVDREGDRLRYTITDNIAGQESMLVVVTKQGTEFVAGVKSASVENGVRTRVAEVASIPWQKVDHIEFRTRPFYYVDFKDVPLRPTK